MSYKQMLKQNPFAVQWLLLIAALLTVGVVIGLHIYRDYEHTRDVEEERLRSVVRMLNQNITQNLKATKNMLAGLRQYQTGRKIDQNINERLQSLCDTIPGVRTLLILDAEGNIKASNRLETIGKNFSHRDYFQTPKKHPNLNMFYVSEPFTSVLGTYTLNVSVVITGQRGEFSGIISAGLDPAYFKPLMKSVLYAPDMWTTVVHGDGALFMIIPEQGNLTGKKLPPESGFYKHKESGRDEFVYRALFTTGEERLIVGHTTAAGLKINKPLFVAASRNYKAVFADWRQYVFMQSMLYGLFILASILGLYVFQKRQQSFNRQKARMETKIKEAEENYRALAENAADGILIVSGNDNIVFANKSAADITGLSISRLIEAGAKSLLNLDIIARIMENNKSGSPSVNRLDPQETVIAREDGTNVFVEITSAETLWERKPAHLIFIRDITVRKAAEEKIAATARELERSNKELDDFAYIASHDLKEPLRGIHNYATFLLEDYEDKIDDAGREKLKTLTYLTKRMDGFIEDLLAFSRVNKIRLSHGEVNLNILVKDVLTILKPIIEKEGVDVRIRNALPPIQADEKQIIKIFQNLIANAIKYNDKKDKWVEIGFSTVEKKPIVFYVQDNGIGIDSKFFDSIFKIFKRLHPRDKFGGGSGAGLTIVKKIVERHGGKIWLESTQGVGTTFYFTLEGDKHGH